MGFKRSPGTVRHVGVFFVPAFPHVSYHVYAHIQVPFATPLLGSLITSIASTLLPPPQPPFVPCHAHTLVYIGTWEQRAQPTPTLPSGNVSPARSEHSHERHHPRSEIFLCLPGDRTRTGIYSTPNPTKLIPLPASSFYFRTTLALSPDPPPFIKLFIIFISVPLLLFFVVFFPRSCCRTPIFSVISPLSSQSPLMGLSRNLERRYGTGCGYGRG